MKVLLCFLGTELQGASALDIIISFVSDPSVHSSEFLAQALQALKPKGKLVLHEPLQGRSFTASEDLSSRLMLTGFSDTKIASSGDMIEVLATFFASANLVTQIITFKPEWEVGDSQKVAIKKPHTSNTWSLASNEAELIDEDSLLSESDKYTKPSSMCTITTTLVTYYIPPTPPPTSSSLK